MTSPLPCCVRANLWTVHLLCKVSIYTVCRIFLKCWTTYTTAIDISGQSLEWLRYRYHIVHHCYALRIYWRSRKCWWFNYTNLLSKVTNRHNHFTSLLVIMLGPLVSSSRENNFVFAYALAYCQPMPSERWTVANQASKTLLYYCWYSLSWTWTVGRLRVGTVYIRMYFIKKLKSSFVYYVCMNLLKCLGNVRQSKSSPVYAGIFLFALIYLGSSEFGSFFVVNHRCDFKFGWQLTILF